MWYPVVFIVGAVLGAAGVWFVMRKYKKQINDILEKAKIPDEVKQ